MKKVKGQGLVEYALILIIIIIVVVGLLQIAAVATHKECTEGHFYSAREMACLPGYKP